MKYHKPKNCMYVKHIEPELWDFTNRYLDTYDHNSLCDKNKTPEHYYIKLCSHFLNTEFDFGEELPPKHLSHIKKVNDLPVETKVRALDSLGINLGLTGQHHGKGYTSGGGVSVLPAIYRCFNYLIESEIS